MTKILSMLAQVEHSMKSTACVRILKLKQVRVALSSFVRVFLSWLSFKQIEIVLTDLCFMVLHRKNYCGYYF